jgi:hypothetical protein
MTWSFQRLNQPILGCLSKQSTEASTVYRSQARRAGGRGRFLGRVCPCRIAHRASALGCQRLGTGARDRSSRGAWRALPDAPFRGRVWEPSQGSHHTGRVRTRKPSAPPAASARPMACGRRGVVPAASPQKPSAALPDPASMGRPPDATPPAGRTGASGWTRTSRRRPTG